MVHRERIDNLRAFGYTEREAEFLTLVALHSGYFTRNQFVRFCGIHNGYADWNFTRRIVRLQHAKRCHSDGIFLAHSPEIYSAIGEPNSRLGRDSDGLIAQRNLIGLDYILKHRSWQWLESNHAKTEALGPHAPKGIFFSMPMALDGQSVRLLYLDSGSKLLRFSTFLHAYEPVLRRIPFEIIYLACHSGPFKKAEETFRKVFDPDAGKQRLTAYFHSKKERESNPEMIGWDTQRLDFFMAASKEFSGSEFDAIYARWKVSGSAAIEKEFSWGTGTLTLETAVNGYPGMRVQGDFSFTATSPATSGKISGSMAASA